MAVSHLWLCPEKTLVKIAEMSGKQILTFMSKSVFHIKTFFFFNNNNNNNKNKKYCIVYMAVSHLWLCPEKTLVK